ncbi:MAG: N-acetylmuramoyl-L-alanine amidase [Longicatena sp.]
MAYEPRNRTYKIRWKFALPLLFLLVLVIYAMGSIFFSSTRQEEKFTVCKLNETQTQEALNKKAGETYMISDYLYYGESLGLYKDTYAMNVEDGLAGKTVELHNVCNDETTSLTMDKDLDQKITLKNLKPGFYDVTIIENLVKKRIVFKDSVKSEPFYMAKRNNKVNKVSIIATKDLLKDYNISMDKNYMFLNVQETTPSNDKIDVYIDPYGMNTDYQFVPDKGSIGNGLSEYEETYDAALIMKKQLESYGLRVEVGRDSVSKEAKSAYGKDGRFANAYQKDAKYYVTLRFNKSENSTFKGVEMWHSSYTSSVLGKNIMFGLTKNLGMQPSEYGNSDGSGVGRSPSKDGFDSIIYVRETGGRATFAGMYSDLAKKENASFKDANGMHALEIDFAYVSNSDDAKNWKENKEKIAKQTADSFAEAIEAK